MTRQPRRPLLSNLLTPNDLNSVLSGLERRALNMERAKVPVTNKTVTTTTIKRQWPPTQFTPWSPPTQTVVPGAAIYVIVQDNDASNVAICSLIGGAFTLVSRPSGFDLLDANGNAYNTATHSGDNHWISYFHVTTPGFEAFLLSSPDLSAWTTELSGLSNNVRGGIQFTGAGGRLYRAYGTIDGLSSKLEYSDDNGATWTTIGDLWTDAPGNADFIDVSPTSDDLFATLQDSASLFASYLAAWFTSDGGGTFSTSQIPSSTPADLPGRLGYSDGESAFDFIPGFAVDLIRFTASGRMLVLCPMEVDGGNSHFFNSDYLLLFYADSPYTSWTVVTLSGPYASGAWNFSSSAVGLAESRDSAHLFAFSNNSADPQARDGPDASNAGTGHVYGSSDDGASWSELASPGGFVRGLYYDSTNDVLYAQMSTGGVQSLATPLTGATWTDMTAALKTALGSTSLSPYVQNGIWS